jgi:hypothetical protein
MDLGTGKNKFRYVGEQGKATLPFRADNETPHPARPADARQCPGVQGDWCYLKSRLHDVKVTLALSIKDLSDFFLYLCYQPLHGSRMPCK